MRTPLCKSMGVGCVCSIATTMLLLLAPVNLKLIRRRNIEKCSVIAPVRQYILAPMSLSRLSAELCAGAHIRNVS
jgi:hypothetical protein